MSQHNPLQVTTPKARLSFPDLFEPKAFGKDKEPKYKATFLFDKNADLTEMREAVKLAAKEKWGDVIPKGIKLPFIDGNTKEMDGYEDTIVVNASSKFPPQVVNQKCDAVTDKTSVYAGCYVRGSLIANAWEYTEGKSVMGRGVSFYLSAVQKVADGEPFAKRQNASDLFGAVDTGQNDKSNFESDDFFG